jgi:hypothetical protein
MYGFLCAVLFNIYGPCVQAGDEQRIRFKLSFYQTLQVSSLLALQSARPGAPLLIGTNGWMVWQT